MDAIFSRTSSRQFTSQPVDSKFITKIISAAMAAPSAMNQKAWEFFVITNPDTLAQLSHVTPYASSAANAPVSIVPCWNTALLRVPEMVQIDMAMSTQNILLEAEALGLGAVMLGIAPIPERMNAVAKILSLPDSFKPFTIVPIGWPLNKHPQKDRYDPSRIHTL